MATRPAAAAARASRSAAAAAARAQRTCNGGSSRGARDTNPALTSSNRGDAAAFIGHHNGNHLTSSAAKERRKKVGATQRRERTSIGIARSRRMTFTRARASSHNPTNIISRHITQTQWNYSAIYSSDAPRNHRAKLQNASVEDRACDTSRESANTYFIRNNSVIRILYGTYFRKQQIPIRLAILTSDVIIYAVLNVF